MTRRFQTIGLIGKYQSADVAEAVTMLAGFLYQRGHSVWVEQNTATTINMASGGFPIVGYDKIGEQADLVLVLGGDGTMLASARRLARHGVPLVGINQGHLGFMTEIAREEAIAKLSDILDGHYKEEQRAMICAEILRGEQRVLYTDALNDVVLNKGELGRMIEFSLDIDGEHVYTLRSDGIIVATPTGSTAYALSAHGPILHPLVGGVALVPLCPHTLTASAVTLPDNCTIDIRLLSPLDARIHFDGQERCDVCSGDLLRVTRAPYSVRFLRTQDYSYYAMLREKLHWSTTPRHWVVSPRKP